MKLKRVLAKDTRTALAMIKDSLGDDAVILSNNKIAGEVEIVGAIDYDEKRLTAQSSTAFSDRLSANLDRIKSQRSQHKRPIAARNVGSELRQSSGFKSPLQPAISTNHQAPVNDNMVRMEKELGLLRLLLEQQMSQSLSQNESFISAAAIKVAQRLERMGFEKRLIDPLLAQLPACDDGDQLWDHAQQWLQDNLTTSSEGVVHEAGIYALVGPTGVGKTTAIGKLGAQLAMKHGKHKVALISMDQQRIGARDQLRVFGTMLGIDVHHVAGFTELTTTLNQIAHKEYVLVDTSGGNPFDPHIQSLVDGLLGVPQQINIYLTLAANSQSHSLRYLMKHYLGQVKGVVATKLDECLPLGGLLAALIESKQPLAMITDGQRIPLDLGYPSSQQLVAHAVEAELAEEHGSIEALSKLLHATPGKPLGSGDRATKKTISTMSSNFGSIQDTPSAAMGLASYRSH
ncbi:flagellar biosynthesis protein FlhF [Candidatus Njordibacter sp. Uisw_039]|jgi:flagellar biosynthesis protein FlhF|uniref:flagellar biosynthesis protein FlhF n=1 Tax=Candidatus Njordibacter sp. Uisw_039 TaxID=3230972 RepID=UPI003A121FD0|tara:strand:+ start:500 stop:1876 length:1377 start_codon:yes stop_codon:yes gene_type:complete